MGNRCHSVPYCNTLGAFYPCTAWENLVPITALLLFTFNPPFTPRGICFVAGRHRDWWAKRDGTLLYLGE